jgi:hypothetical protein
VQACLHTLQWFLAGGGKKVWLEGDDDADPLFTGEVLALVTKWMAATAEAAATPAPATTTTTTTAAAAAEGHGGGGEKKAEEEEGENIGKDGAAGDKDKDDDAEAVVARMMDDVVVQTRGCALIGSFLMGGEAKAEKVVRLKKGVDAVFAAMRHHEGNEDVQCVL